MATKQGTQAPSTKAHAVYDSIGVIMVASRTECNKEWVRLVRAGRKDCYVALAPDWRRF